MRKNNKLRQVASREPRQVHYPRRPPFWFPASSYYILTVAITIALFFLIWGILIEGGEENPWILAGLMASIVLAGAVFLREVILSKARQRYLLAERRLDHNLKNIPSRKRERYKLGVKKNAELVSRIRKKSDAAKILGHLPEGHWEVFEMCNKYLAVNQRQLETAGAGSPRIAALRRGRDIVEPIKKYHLLTWAEIESRLLTQEASNQIRLSDKIELTQKALAVIVSALDFYPDDPMLRDSKMAIKEFIATIKVSHWIEQAERQTFKKNYKKAVSLYRDALFYLARENIKKEESELIAEKINDEIDKIREIVRKIDNRKSTLLNIERTDDD